MKVSIKQVAKEAGVSVSTVSKVINNYSSVNEETRKHVQETIERLGYKPNVFGLSLSSKNLKRVALVIFTNNNQQSIDEINMNYLFGAFDGANTTKMEVVPYFSYALKRKSIEQVVNEFYSQGITGIIIYSLYKNNEIFNDILNQQLFKAVVVDTPLTNEQTSSVMIDHRKAQYDVAKKTLEGKDIKSVLYLAGREDGWVTDMRLEGIKELKKDMGFDLQIEYASFKEKQALELTLKYGKKHDAIICASDLMASGAIHALKKLNHDIPVSGFDGISLLAYIDSDVYTVNQNFYKISQVAMQELLNLYNGETGQSIELDYEIVVKQYEDTIY